MLDILLPQVTDEVEVLVSDNASTDNTLEIIKEYQERYPGVIRLLRNETNIGADGNFLQCMFSAMGKHVMMISDDDIIVEGAVERILTFLKTNPEVTLAYLESVAFKDHYRGVDHCHGYKYLKEVPQDIVTTDKAELLSHCIRLFGFTSVHIWLTERIRSIDNPKRFFNTYFLQTYICIECAKHPEDKLGLIHGPNIAVGEYGIVVNYDVAEVEGIKYHKMIDYAVANGFPKRFLEHFYIWKAIYLIRMYLIKERAIGVRKMKISNVFKATWRYPKAWIELYPFFLLPPFVCRIGMKLLRKAQGRSFLSYVNRPTE